MRRHASAPASQLYSRQIQQPSARYPPAATARQLCASLQLRSRHQKGNMDNFRIERPETVVVLAYVRLSRTIVFAQAHAVIGHEDDN